jgi:preprotein translocase subunit SecG
MTWPLIIQVVSAILLMAAILMQNRGTGLSGVFGGSGNVYRTKRGIEKTLFTASIILSIVFFLASFLSVLLK